MIFRNKALTFCLIWSTVCVTAQTRKQALTVEELAGWQRVTKSSISDNGRLVAVKHEPWKGDATVLLFNEGGKELERFTPAGDFRFSPSSDFLIVQEKASEAETEALKLRKAKKEEMPMDRLILYSASGQRETIDSIQVYKASETTDWIAYKRGNAKKDSTLYIRSLDGKMKDSIPAVSDFGFAEKGAFLYCISAGDTLGFTPGIYTYRTVSREQTLVKQGKGSFKQAKFSKEGDKLAFLYANENEKDSANAKSLYALFLAIAPDTARIIAERGNKSIPESWIISANGTPEFSDNGEFLFFPTSPAPRERDTTVLAENRPDVQVWNWDEAVQRTQQHANRKRDENKTYTASYHIPSNGITQLNTVELPNLQLPDAGHLALISTTEPYGTERMWTGRSRQDLYIINIVNGERSRLLTGSDARVRISPEGKYACWYSEPDSSWFSCQLDTKEIHRLTTPETFAAWNTDNDVPDYPSAYGSAGWLKGDQAILIYDRYDIWQFNPTGGQPVNLTLNGKKEGIRYRLKPLDLEEKYVDTAQPQLLTGFNEATKATGLYSAQLNKPSLPKALLTGSFKATLIEKAKLTDAVIYTTESFSDYPEIRLSDLSFRKQTQLTRLGKQQDSILWGTAELTSWTSLDGKVLEGVIYKPAGFDPNRQYPLIVNFYERNAETLYSYRMPEPHRSTIDYRLYNSNGYIIFNPDIRYSEGYPGEDCFNSVMPGIASLISKGYIDEKAIAAQGHSWGGYQVAYLATRTNLFAAIESGAPVVNMFSAYGGIRWETGLNRSFQYEHGQSRIGATPWERPLRYIENSPLFTMDKVTTPILIMHNDADGHVPWYQGIEYFIALKRLQKPVWLLNYTGEPHWPMKMPNRIDFQKRMFQFFEHYLKGAPMPQWMSEGVKAVDQPFDLGY